MNLDKSDLKEIKKIVDGSVEEKVAIIVKKEITGVKEELKDFIGKEIESLASMTKRSFDNIDAKFVQMDKRFDKLEKGQQQIKRDISNLEFIATEMVRRDEFLELKQRFTKIEAKLNLTK